jgi:biotin transport system substrate-specific component
MTMLNLAHPALAAAVWPADARPAARALRFALLAVLGVIFIALCAQARVPFYPVPMTGQTFAVLLVGTVFGWRLGIATLLLYMGAGAVGIPVFANWSHGPGVIAGATGGYIIGFVLAAALLGYLAQRGWSRNIVLSIVGMVLAEILIYLPGVPWLAVWYAKRLGRGVRLRPHAVPARRSPEVVARGVHRRGGLAPVRPQARLSLRRLGCETAAGQTRGPCRIKSRTATSDPSGPGGRCRFKSRTASSDQSGGGSRASGSAPCRASCGSRRCSSRDRHRAAR